MRFSATSQVLCPIESRRKSIPSHHCAQAVKSASLLFEQIGASKSNKRFFPRLRRYVRPSRINLHFPACAGLCPISWKRISLPFLGPNPNRIKWNFPRLRRTVPNQLKAQVSYYTGLCSVKSKCIFPAEIRVALSLSKIFFFWILQPKRKFSGCVYSSFFSH